MNLNVTVRGANLDELNARSAEVCQTFYGGKPFEMVEQPWAAVIAEYDEAGNVANFRFDLQAREPVTA